MPSDKALKRIIPKIIRNFIKTTPDARASCMARALLANQKAQS